MRGVKQRNPSVSLKSRDERRLGVQGHVSVSTLPHVISCFVGNLNLLHIMGSVHV